MRLRKIILLLLLHSICMSAFGQVKSSDDLIDALMKDPKSIGLVQQVTNRMADLRGEISLVQSDISAMEDSIARYETEKGRLALKQPIVTEENCKILVSYFVAVFNQYGFVHECNRKKQYLDTVEGELNTLEAKKGFVDTCVIRIALASLSKPYDETLKRVSEEFKKINPVLQRELSGIVPLLDGYEEFTADLIKALEAAQKDNCRRINTAVATYPGGVLRKLKEMPYYKKYYNTSWYIPYLNKMIDKAMAEVRKHSKNYRADFTGLLTELGWKEEASM